jgi:5-methylcytosine-specific restriction endonuclease McrA
MTRLMVICKGCGDMVAPEDERQSRCLARCYEPWAEEQAEKAKRWNATKNAHPRREVYDDPRWQDTRAVVFRRDSSTCQACGRHILELDENETLVCDHVESIAKIVARGGDPFDASECQALCSSCSGAKDGPRQADVHLPAPAAASGSRLGAGGAEGGAPCDTRAQSTPAPSPARETSTTAGGVR